ncbi:MAG: Cys-tRNA(Pro) deacylase [Bacilli bacterium]|nr:Cys-tRNA(Pro) deacylase [Bacilli bacterium]
MTKTNAVRLLEVAKIPYETREYDNTLTVGTKIAQLLGEDPDRVFKTLVCEDRNHNHYVFCIPVNAELDLKKAAKVSGSKSIDLIPQKQLLPLTGYVHGGCSPIGMKKSFPTFIEETSLLFDSLFVSGGKIGLQLLINTELLISYTNAITAALIK